MKPNILKSNLFNPGVKFIAAGDVKDNTLPPGSLGFLSYFKNPDRDYQNVAHAAVIVIRRGKAGQDRVEQRDVSFPIFTDKRMLKHDEYLPIGRKFYIHIKKEPFTKKDLMDVSPLEFLGWCYAYSKYLRYITKNYVYPAKNAVWTDETVGRHLTSTGRIPEHFVEDPAATTRTFACKEFRSDYITAARKLEAKLIKCVCSYKKTAVAAALNSSCFVEHTNENHYEVVDPKLTKPTVDFYKAKYDKILSLIEEHKFLMKKSRGLQNV